METVDGDTPIEDIAVGDRVWAENLATGKPELRTVTGFFHKEADELLTISVGDQTVHVTPQHPFWVPGRGWITAGDLKVGDHLLRKDGSEETITAITDQPGEVTVYNFTVEGDHDYFVADVDALVHNCAKGSKGGWRSHFAPGEDPTVREVLRFKLGKIFRAPLDPGSPSWNEIMDDTMSEIERAAKARETGYDTI